MTDKVLWNNREFSVYAMGGEWNDVGGVYIFTGVRDNSWHALYVGLTESFKTRCPSHERWLEAVKYGATHVHAMVVRDELMRASIEQELIRLYQPPLNTHHR